MQVNLSRTERIVRSALGVVALGAGLLIGRLSWWGIALDIAGALLLLNATTGFCHIYKVLGLCTAEKDDCTADKQG